MRGLSVAYRRKGQGEPTLFLHGAGFTRMWLPFYERLAYESSPDDLQLAAYQEFLILCKDADPDIPVLQQAKAEYAKLQ